MDKERFVEKLKQLAPSKEDLKKYHISDDFIDEWISSYLCKIKHERELKILPNDAVLSLLQDYDCSHVHIGLVVFLEHPIEETGFYQIGLVDIDVLVLNKITLQIEVRDHDALNHTIWPCAANSNCFLDALLVCADYLSVKAKNVFQEEDAVLILSYVDECVEKAGGEKYRNFYNMILGYGE